MKIQSVRIINHDIDSVTKFLEQNIKLNYYSKVENMSILCSEKFYLRTESTQMNMVVLKRHYDDVIIDIIGAGGGVSILGISLWSESGFIKEIIAKLTEYCQKNALKLEKDGKIRTEISADDGI